MVVPGNPAATAVQRGRDQAFGEAMKKGDPKVTSNAMSRIQAAAGNHKPPISSKIQKNTSVDPRAEAIAIPKKAEMHVDSREEAAPLPKRFKASEHPPPRPAEPSARPTPDQAGCGGAAQLDPASALRRVQAMAGNVKIPAMSIPKKAGAGPPKEARSAAALRLDSDEEAQPARKRASSPPEPKPPRKAARITPDDDDSSQSEWGDDSDRGGDGVEVFAGYDSDEPQSHTDDVASPCATKAGGTKEGTKRDQGAKKPIGSPKPTKKEPSHQGGGGLLFQKKESKTGGGWKLAEQQAIAIAGLIERLERTGTVPKNIGATFQGMLRNFLEPREVDVPVVPKALATRLERLVGLELPLVLPPKRDKKPEKDKKPPEEAHAGAGDEQPKTPREKEKVACRFCQRLFSVGSWIKTHEAKCERLMEEANATAASVKELQEVEEDEEKVDAVEEDEEDEEEDLEEQKARAMAKPLKPIPKPGVVRDDPRLQDIDDSVSDIPLLCPTEEEFADPLAYIESQAAHFAKYGIGIIEPPDTWKARRLQEDKWGDDFEFTTKWQKLSPAQREDGKDPGFTVDSQTKYTLSSFRTHADQFRRQREREGFPLEDVPDPNEVERHFWRRMYRCNSSRDREVHVRYGSDVEQTIMRNDPWAPADIPHFGGEQGGVLSYTKGEGIPGVTTPFLYIGQLFSMFCWHTEDNDLYSINYLHDGAAKTWFGVPPDRKEEVERCFAAYFEFNATKFPDLHYRKCTMFHPTMLTSVGIPVHRIVQRAGQIAITAPSGYHAGFSHGFNIAESTNFACRSWIPIGSRVAEEYRNTLDKGQCRTSVVNMDEILWEMVDRHRHNMDGSSLCEAAVVECGRRIKRELGERAKFTARHPGVEVLHCTQEGTVGSAAEGEGEQEEEPALQGDLCWRCHHPCFFSCVVSDGLVACLRHAREMVTEGVAPSSHVRWFDDATLDKWLVDNDMVHCCPMLPPKEKRRQHFKASKSSKAKNSEAKIAGTKIRQEKAKENAKEKAVLEKWWRKHAVGENCHEKLKHTFVSTEERQKLADEVGNTLTFIDTWLVRKRQLLRRYYEREFGVTFQS